ncbi:MAG: hypothetical protein IPM29_06145 [Planctomycetes bacterium]|nr:hypothetical protein [Planctomycetota bacterium]
MITAIEGFLAGAAHVLTGPDHLVGVAPLAVDRSARVRPALVGASWGLGHGIGVACLGVLAQTVMTVADVEVASGWAERLVGLVLVVLGAVAIRKGRTLVVHEHVHEHDGSRHVHLHVHERGELDAEHSGAEDAAAVHPRVGAAPGHRHHHTAFGIGVVHGLAGAGHFWAVLPSAAMRPADAAVYIGAYLVTTLLTMAAFGALLGRFADRMGPRVLPRILTGVGAITVGVGVAWFAMTVAG